ncbi:Aminoglycoside N(6')-acetyltransferase type 1 [Pedobacter sp. Bi27]|uniref:GNAT family N-acetyltransferase n=1 Tax=unclassified Pedobacter TaxID=2628915 RepID=UPI001D9D2B31|nr:MULTISPECIES: GNAT family N-acetyltransferase [unclassified Pedobacter]CAH0179132.1 Aminoglycoside N(6')-acetyltransferase type 1 [Pedobacter sp. Bi27]CAH0294533.1 Aminoglycoside N(6')-acetyltransferase type 1 [Pedobacter sp. Bi36]CAH0305545.1 Aminoglycoside N(6')-acetyltransferase type 1 [Pedobacter sp. Bi126]
MVQIREISEKDAESVATLSTQLGYESDIKQTSARIKRINNSNENCAFVALVDGKVVGWIHGFYTLRLESDPFIEIGGLIVDENYRNLKIGKQLIENVNLWAKKHQVKKLKVRCNIKRTESHKFYERLGFKENKRQIAFEMNVI